MKNSTFISVLCIASAAFICVAPPATADKKEDERVRQEVTSYMDAIRSGERQESSREKAVRALPTARLLAELPRYRNDREEKVRSEALILAWGIANQNKFSRPTRQQAMRYIFGAATSEPSPGLARSATELLLQFSAAEFTSAMRTVLLRSLLNQEARKIDSLLVKVVGVADVKAAEARLRELADGGFQASHMARLALARMGDEAAIQAIVAAATSNPDPQGDIPDVLRDLNYIRQPEGVEGLVRFLFSDGVQKGNGSNVPDFSYARRTIDHLADVIEGFPRYVDAPEAREWITKQGGASKLKIKR